MAALESEIWKRKLAALGIEKINIKVSIAKLRFLLRLLSNYVTS